MFDRTLYKIISDIDKTFPVVLITGPRQVGKTTLLEMCAKENRTYVTLDDMDIRQLAQNDPALFFQTYKPPLIIDEVQYAPELFSQIKIIVDREKKDGLFWLTGSQKFHLMKNITETLAGRVAIVDMLGLSQRELTNRASTTKPFMPTEDWINKAKQTSSKKKSVTDIFDLIWRGSFPKLYKNKNVSRDLFYKSYVQTYIHRDVKSILSITDDISFYKFLGAIAARTGQLLNYTELARDVGIDNKTVKSWISVLETSGLIYILYPYHNNMTKRIVKTPKLYFLDTGLCSYLTKWPDAASLEAGLMSGAMLETYIIIELLKTYWHNGVTPHFYYYRDLDQKEVDLLIEAGDTLYPVEFKKTATPSSRATKRFYLLEKLGKKIGHGAVICFIEKEMPLSKEVTAIPVYYI